MMSKILVVDDDKNILDAFEQVLTEHGYEVSRAQHGREALGLLQAEKLDLVIMDIRLPGMSGLETLEKIKEFDTRLPVIIVTGYGTMETAVEAMKLGAIDYQLKPLNPQDILQSIEYILESLRIMKRPVKMDEEQVSEESDAIVGHSECMRDVYKSIGRVAETNMTVLIRGETGTGKELVARAIYQHSQRAQAPLVVVNCVAIPETLLESEFFGYEKGAFTGAHKRKLGKFEQADKGTIFLDEIGDMPLGTQAKLLRVLQERVFERIGGTERVDVDVRVIAATNRNLEEAITQGRFREDLYHRLKVFTIDIPPLRKRKEDIPYLVSYFAERFSRQIGTGTPVITPEAMQLLRAYNWPGNVRELQNCVQQAMILSQGYPVRHHHITKIFDAGVSKTNTILEPPKYEELASLLRNYLITYCGSSAHTEILEAVEKTLITEALRIKKGNQTHAAQLLGMARPTLKAKLDKYGLTSA
jgi:DNA-binding NtrC family response regulator